MTWNTLLRFICVGRRVLDVPFFSLRLPYSLFYWLNVCQSLTAKYSHWNRNHSFGRNRNINNIYYTLRHIEQIHKPFWLSLLQSFHYYSFKSPIVKLLPFTSISFSWSRILRRWTFLLHHEWKTFTILSYRLATTWNRTLISKRTSNVCNYTNSFKICQFLFWTKLISAR